MGDRWVSSTHEYVLDGIKEMKVYNPRPKNYNHTKKKRKKHLLKKKNNLNNQIKKQI